MKTELYQWHGITMHVNILNALDVFIHDKSLHFCFHLPYQNVVFYILSAGYPYYQTVYQAPNGVILSTSGTPYCRTVHSRDSGRCVTDNSWMANLFLSTSSHYYTTSSSPVVTYRFPLPLFLEYMLVYPLCSSDHWTSYYARIYHNNSVVAGTDGWVNPTNCLQGQPSKLVVRLHVDKVGLVTIKDWGVRSIPDSLSFAIRPCKICGGGQIRVPRSIHSCNQRALSHTISS